MKSFEINAYELTMVDGDGVRDIHVGFMSNKIEAEAWVASTQGWGRMSKFKKNFVVYDSVAELKQGQKQEAREKALAKLTAEERELLGL